MESRDSVVEIDELERSLLRTSPSNDNTELAKDEDEGQILHTASFEEADFIKYHMARWVMYSLCMILAWGIGLLMLLYLPVRLYVLRKDLRSRKLYVTSNAIIYKVIRPVAFPCFGVLKMEKHILLPSVADIVIEQGYLQSRFGVYSLRIENSGVRRPSRDDVQIQGIVNPLAFKKAVLMHLSNTKREEPSVSEDTRNLRIIHSVPSMSPSKSFRHDSYSHIGEQVILQKLEEVGSSVKRLQSLIEETSKSKD